MSLEGYSKVFFGPRVPPATIEVKPGFLKPGSEPKAKSAGYQGPSYGLSHLKAGKWQPKPLARPGFLADQPGVAKSGKQGADYEAAKVRYQKAEGEAEKAKAEYEKFENTAKGFRSLGKEKEAKLYTSKAAVAKQNYEQKKLAAQGAKQKMEKVGAKYAKPSVPAKGIAPAGEELSGPTGLTLAKNHSALSAPKQGVA
ncbi:MAG: hypothetical protein U1F66_09740 [bacterium]